AVSRLAPEADWKRFGALTYGVRSIEPDRIPRARLVSLAKKVTVMRWTGTLPPHQCGLADSVAPLVGSKLSTFHGPVPISRTPGWPKVPLWAWANFISKMSELYS